MTTPFWKNKTLAEMSTDEWESLCDGCGKCCLHKLEDEGTGDVYYTRVACRLLDITTSRCKNYAQRHQSVPDCLQMNAEFVVNASWLPSTCAYRLVAEKKDLPSWHPLITGNAQSVHEANASVKDKAVPEQDVHEDDFEDYLIDRDP